MPESDNLHSGTFARGIAGLRIASGKGIVPVPQSPGGSLIFGKKGLRGRQNLLGATQTPVPFLEADQRSLTFPKNHFAASCSYDIKWMPQVQNAPARGR